MKTAFSIVFLLALLSPAHAHHYRQHHHYTHRHQHYRHYAHRHHVHYASRSGVTGQPAPLVSKVHELERDCGARVISGFRPGARVAGTRRISNHALNLADDMVGNYTCMYAHLRGWPGGYSTDSGRVHHIHISYNRQKEWGARFVHGGGYRHYASRRHRYALAR